MVFTHIFFIFIVFVQSWVLFLLISSNSYFLNSDIIIDRYLTLKISDKFYDGLVDLDIWEILGVKTQSFHILSFVNRK